MLLSVRKDLLKEGDSLVISDEETLTQLNKLASVLKSKGLGRYRKGFPDYFRNVLTSSSVYASGIGNRFDVKSFSNSLESLRKSVKHLETYNSFALKLSDEYIRITHGERLKGLGFLVENNRLVSTKYRDEIHYILKTYPNDKTYKLFIKDELLYKLLVGNQDQEKRLIENALKKGEYAKLNTIKAELNRGKTKIKEIEKILMVKVVETRRLNKEFENVVDPYAEDKLG